MEAFHSAKIHKVFVQATVVQRGSCGAVEGNGTSYMEAQKNPGAEGEAWGRGMMGPRVLADRYMGGQ